MKIEEALKQPKFGSARQKALINIMYTYSWVTGIQKDVFIKYDITPQQYNVLRILKGRYPNSICAGEIKEVMIDRSPDLTRLCDRLVKKELIERQVNEYNRRQALIKITSVGLELLKEMDPSLKNMSKRFGNLTEEEAEKLSDLLDKFRG
jgi:DNA-binding MarR family transcriptional regulator